VYIFQILLQILLFRIDRSYDLMRFHKGGYKFSANCRTGTAVKDRRSEAVGRSAG
jgi:hypothetical protein